MKVILFAVIALTLIFAVGFGYNLGAEKSCSPVVKECNEFLQANCYDYQVEPELRFNSSGLGSIE